MADNKDKPETNIVPGGDETPPEKRDTSKEDAENKARHDALFGDLEDEEGETPEEIKAHRNELWKKVADMEVRLSACEHDYDALNAKLEAQKTEVLLARAKMRGLAEAEKAASVEAFVKESTLTTDALAGKLSAIPGETRAADAKFDKLAQGVEKSLSQLSAVFNKYAGKTSAPGDKTAEITVTDTAQKMPVAKEQPIRKDETPEEIKAERDLLLQQMAALADKIGKAQQLNFSLTKQIEAQKTEAAQALAREQNQLNGQKPFALEKILKEILPAVDNLERGLSAIPAASRAADAKFEGLARDVEKTLGELGAVFNKFGVKEINPKGEAYDPDQHEAISTDDSADVESDTVVGVAQKGYSLNDRVIRPAKVIVKI